MSQILIITIPGDLHAHAARWALTRSGHDCRRWFAQDLETSPATVHLDDERCGVTLSGPDGAIDTADLTAAWLRRFRPPEPPETMDAGDRQVAQRESESFLRGLQFALAPRLWANSPTAQRPGTFKVPQLVAARRVGLAIPRTVMTNDMAEVRALFDSAKGRIIYKGFHPAVWRNESDQFMLNTALLRAEHLEDDESLRLSPGIFQAFVPKAYELRVTIFGRTCIAAKISEQHEIDWRTTHQMRVEPHQLPAAVEAKLFALMDQLGLAMGTADLIVTPEGEHVFLEVNEQGQFLWVEQFNPEIAMLEPFAQFLASGDARFRWTPHAPSESSFTAYLASPDVIEFERTEMTRLSAGKIVVPEPKVETTTNQEKRDEKEGQVEADLCAPAGQAA